jgi:hypothetical protein
LDTRFQLPKFSGHINDEAIDLWVRSLSTYFKTCPRMAKEEKLQITSLQLEGVLKLGGTPNLIPPLWW